MVLTELMGFFEDLPLSARDLLKEQAKTFTVDSLYTLCLHKFAYESYNVYLKGVVEAVHRRRVHGADHLEDAVKVIELLKDLQDLDDARHHGYTFLQVLRLHNTPKENTQNGRLSGNKKTRHR